MKVHFLIALMIAGICVGLVNADEKKAKEDTSKSSAAAKSQADNDSSPEVSIRATAKAFMDAFNRGDAKAVAAHWIDDGEYVNEDGQRFVGCDAIQQQYENFFAHHPKAKIQIAVDSVRLIGDDTYVEDGRAAVGPLPTGPPAVSRYLAIHVKRDGKWLMATVRDSRTEIPSTYGHLSDLEWLIGTWSTEHEGVHVESTCRWIAHKSFIERSYAVKQGGHFTSSGTQIIGWDAVNGQITSWNFTSGGGHAVGVWTPHENGWIVENTGITKNGVQTTSKNIWSRLNENALVWKSVDRAAGQDRLADLAEVVLKRN